MNKRAVENLIKAGACDSLDGTRKQMVEVYASIIDQTAQKRKSSMSGQMSLFELVSDEEKREYEVKYPDVGEFEKEVLLGFEKEVLGIYLSGHPLEEYAQKMQKNITANAIDFVREEETQTVKVTDNAHVVVGGMIANKTVKFTRNNKAMAFIEIEDLTGTVEIIIFPKDYERYQQFLGMDEKIFVVGRATVEEEQNGKIICERIVPFSDTRKDLWLQFPTVEEYRQREQELLQILRESDGMDEVVIYVTSSKQVKRLGANCTVQAEEPLLGDLCAFLGENNVKVVEKNIENK